MMGRRASAARADDVIEHLRGPGFSWRAAPNPLPTSEPVRGASVVPFRVARSRMLRPAWLSAQPPQDFRSHEPEELAPLRKALRNLDERCAPLAELQPLRIPGVKELRQDRRERRLVPDQGDGGLIGIRGQGALELVPMPVGVPKRLEASDLCVPAPGLGRDVRRLARAQKRARQQPVRSVDEPREAPRGLAELALPLGRQRPFVVAGARCTVRKGDGVADEQ